MAKKKTPVTTDTTALVPITDGALLPVVGSDAALAKMPGVGGAVARESGVTLIAGRPYTTGGGTVPASEIYFVDGAKVDRAGPWLHEADKVAWLDPASGFECIMMRDTNGGFLSGYVGVPRDHPLWGWNEDAIGAADLGIEVHGGLNYAAICQDGPSPNRRLVLEARRICHVPVHPLRYEPLHHATDYRVHDAHAWWVGFTCNHIYDEVPKSREHRQRLLAAETTAVYRDDGYVVHEILTLAAQLRAVADGQPVPARAGPPLPAIGIDPRMGG